MKILGIEISRANRAPPKMSAKNPTPDTLMDWSGRVLLTPNGSARNTAAGWSALTRCAHLIAGSGASIITEGVRVIDRERKVVKSSSAYRALDLLRESPDDEITAHTFLEDAFVDLCVSGNAVILRSAGMGGRRKLILCEPAATTIEERTGYLEFRVSPDNEYSETDMVVDQSNVIIARNPRIAGRDGRYPRGRFMATPPVQSLARAILVAINSEDYVARWFDRKTGGPKSDLAIEFAEELDEQTQQRFAEYLEEFINGRGPLVLPGGARVAPMTNTPQNSDALGLRSFSVEECCRIFSVPPVLISHSGGGNTFGSSIHALLRLWVETGLKHYVNRMLSALSYRLLPRGQCFAVNWNFVSIGDYEIISKIASQLRPQSGSYDGVISRSEFRHLLGFEDEYKRDWMSPEELQQKQMQGDGEAGE